MAETKQIEDVIEEPGLYKYQDGLGMHFSPIPNWYGAIHGFDCPLCGEVIDWEWVGNLPGFTNPEGIAATGVYPQMLHGGKLLDWGHRCISIECAGCQTLIMAENFD